MITIDGSHGEGGGQIIRSSLALSMMTGQPIRLERIRDNRKPKGLKRQHWTAVRAAQAVCSAEVVGADIGSQQLTFTPSEIVPGEHRVQITSAGSTTLVLQTILPALMLADGESTISLEGGTHNPGAPPFDFLSRCYLNMINRIGPVAEVELHRPGFYPVGGGSWTAHVIGSPRLQPLNLMERGKLVSRRVRGLVSNLPLHIAERECDVIRRQSQWPMKCFQVEQLEAHGPGNVVMIEVEFENVTELFIGFGRQGVKAEKVAKEAWREAERYLKSEAVVGEYLADQLLLPLALGASQGRASRFRTLPLSDHSTTHIDVLQRFLDVPIEVTEEPGTVVVQVG